MQFFARVLSFTIRFLILIKEHISRTSDLGTYIPSREPKHNSRASIFIVHGIRLTKFFPTHSRYIGRIDHDVGYPKIRQLLMYTKAAEPGFINREVIAPRTIPDKILVQRFQFRTLTESLQNTMF